MALMKYRITTSNKQMVATLNKPASSIINLEYRWGLSGPLYWHLFGKLVLENQTEHKIHRLHLK